MIVEPERHVEAFAKAGASMISVHVEASPHLHRTLGALRALGVRAGVALNPVDPRAGALEPVADQLDYAVVMSVDPGFAGQAFIPSSVPPGYGRCGGCSTRRATRRRSRSTVESTPATSRRSSAAGAGIVVAASAIFGPDDAAAATRRLREAAQPPTTARGPRARADRALDVVPRPRALRRDRRDGNRLLWELLHVVRGGPHGSAAQARPALPRPGARRDPAAGGRSALQLPGAGALRRRVGGVDAGGPAVGRPRGVPLRGAPPGGRNAAGDRTYPARGHRRERGGRGASPARYARC